MKLKYILLASLMLLGTVMAQSWNTRYPANVRYIAGGYTNSRPFFSTLNAALNDVKPYATADNPYVFWLDSDTLQIADWDSIYNEGLAMRDSVYQYYVATGKIKWAGFDIDTTYGGRGGTSVKNIGSPSTQTSNYSFWRWDSAGLPLADWQQRIAQNWIRNDSLINARTLFSQVDPIYFSTSGDTLYIDLPAHIFDIDSFYSVFDTTTYIRTTGSQSRTGTLTISAGGVITFGAAAGPLDAGKLILPAYASTTPRAIWADGTYIFYRTGGKDLAAAVIDTTGQDHLEMSDIVTWDNLNDALIDSIIYLIKQPHIFLEDAAYTPNVTGAGTYVRINPKFTETEKYRMTVADDSVTIVTGAAGDYVVRIAFTLQNAAADDFTLQIRKNNVSQHSTRFTGAGASEYITVATWAYLDDLVAGDDISFYITNTVDADDPVMTNIIIFMDRQHE